MTAGRGIAAFGAHARGLAGAHRLQRCSACRPGSRLQGARRGGRAGLRPITVPTRCTVLAGEGKTVRVICGDYNRRAFAGRDPRPRRHLRRCGARSRRVAAESTKTYEERAVYTVSGAIEIAGDVFTIRAGCWCSDRARPDQAPQGARAAARLHGAGRRPDGWPAPYLAGTSSPPGRTGSQQARSARLEGRQASTRVAFTESEFIPLPEEARRLPSWPPMPRRSEAGKIYAQLNAITCAHSHPPGR